MNDDDVYMVEEDTKEPPAKSLRGRNNAYVGASNPLKVVPEPLEPYGSDNGPVRISKMDGVT